MKAPPLTVHMLVNSTHYASSMLDSGCLTYALVSASFVRKANLQCINLPHPKQLDGVAGTGIISRVCEFTYDIEGYSRTGWGYVVEKGNLGYDILLGRSWFNKHNVTIAPAKKSIYIHSEGIRIRLHSKEGAHPPQPIVTEISAVAMHKHIRDSQRKPGSVEIFAASMADIQKALAPKAKLTLEEIRERLPPQYRHQLAVFDPNQAAKLPPHRPGVDHGIELIKQNGKEPEVPWGPLYNMSRDELLVLRKELTSLLDKGFIRVSNSPAAAPVLFAKKPGGGLRLCVDYRALNAITKKDRYPLPLIHETLNNICKAKWLTKLDVIAAFNKIRVKEGDEWKTAFRTRFGLFEWLVMPFGMTNAPSTFQRYINWALRRYLDDFVSAYLDDVLIYTNGSLAQHRAQVNKVLNVLREAGLQLDIKKCEFEVKTTKYLGFIIDAGKGLRMDSEKIKAVRDWKAPTTVKAVRSFLGFANFYRRFIKDFAGIASPLTRLTGDVPFRWTEQENQAFERLKEIFTTEPVLAQFDPDRETVVETDSSGYITGGTLSQYDDQGILRPVAYFSKKHNPHECNYEIHDKEMLAIIRCLEEWDAELRSVAKFTVLTDHKNLEYFTKPRMLNERQIRWSIFLGRYNMVLQYRPGKANVRADALSRREQDLPANANDARLQHRYRQLLKPTTASEEEMEDSTDAVITFCSRVRHTREETAQEPTTTEPSAATTETNTALQDMWNQAISNDQIYTDARQAVINGERRFPVHLELKASIAECRIDEDLFLLYRNRKWVPASEPLRTMLIHETHSSPAAGHPGRENTYKILARDFFWPGMSNDIRRFVRNCDVCGRTKPWRDGLQGFLKPLPLPDRIWKEISMDFIEGLPESNGCTNLLVITDRLSKDVVLIPLENITAEHVANNFLKHVVAYHWLPDAIVSDRGTQFVSHFWTILTKMMGIKRRLSTAWHPQTDGSTERMNSTVEAYLRAYISWNQEDWVRWLPMAAIAIKGREARSTKVSPFFLQHGYNVDPLQLDISQGPNRADLTAEARTDYDKAKAIVEKFQQVFDFAQANMAEAQQEQERQANRHRHEQPTLRVNDKVWLSYRRQLSNRRPSKKLDWKNAKYTVIEVIDSHSVRLNTPPGVNNVFHVDRLRLASSDPFPSQANDDTQPDPILVNGEAESEVERLMAEVTYRNKLFYEVKWSGYALTTFEPAENLEDNVTLDEWETFTAPYRKGRKKELPAGFRRGDEHLFQRNVSRGVL